jgi:glycerol-3-phosphate dehydrogenase subunit C
MSKEPWNNTEETAKGTADHCLSCTSCIANCPVSAATHEYRGPKLVGPAHSRMHFSEDDVEMSLDFCSNCKNCDISCPSGVQVSTLNMLQRGAYYRNHPHSQRDEMLAHGEHMAKMVRSFPCGAAFANLGMKLGQSFGIMGSMGIAKRPMPSYASESFMQRFKHIHQPKSAKKVVFFPGCFINDNEPQVGVAFVQVMNANGYEVLVDKKFNCCGSPLVVCGYLDEAKEHAHNNVSRILAWKKQGIPVIACCTSCSLMLKQEYQELFHEAEMTEAAQNVYDAFEFLAMLDEKGELKTGFHDVNHKYLYHVPCHLRAQGIGLPVLDIMRQIPGLAIETADAGCCGMSGNYGFKGDKYEISMKIGEKLFNRIQQSNADEVLTDCGTCRLQIRHGAKAETCHPIEILAEAYGK